MIMLRNKVYERQAFSFDYLNKMQSNIIRFIIRIARNYQPPSHQTAITLSNYQHASIEGILQPNRLYIM